MRSSLLFLLTSVLIEAPLGVVSWFQLQPLGPTYSLPTYTLTDHGVRYQSQYFQVNTLYRSYIKLVLVPISQSAATTTTTLSTSTTTTTTTPPTTTITTTTTTTTPRPSAAISPGTFFKYANYLPMQLYSNWICAVYRQPSPANLYRHRIGKRQAQLATNSTQEGFRTLSSWLSHGSQLYDEDNIIFFLRQKLLEGFSRNKLDELRTTLVRDFDVPELENIVDFIYGHKIELANRVRTAVQMFYVNDPRSSLSQLADVDLKHLLVDLAVAVNGRAMCLDCDVDFHDEQALIDALIMQLLPPGMNQQQIGRAREGINFLLQAKLEADETSAIVANFVASVTNANLTVADVDKQHVGDEASNSSEPGSEDQNHSQDDDDEDNDDDNDLSNSSEQDSEDNSDQEVKLASLPVFWRIMRPRRQKRSFYYEARFDREMACFLLNNYRRSSTYCGVREIASQIYNYLQCSVCGSPLQPTTSTTTTTTTVASTASTTSRITTTPTATTIPTTTTATTTRQPTSTTLKTTTSQPTTTTPTTTTSQPTITTPSTTTSKPTSTTPTTTTSQPTTTPTTTTSQPATTTPTSTASQPTTTTTTVFPTTEETTAIPAQCGISNIATRSAAVSSSSLFISPRIVGGRITATCTTYPWLVKLSINNGQVCGGSILDEWHILTAAHCVSSKSRIRATIGEYDTSLVEGTEQVFDVSIPTGVSVHPDFSFFSKTNDVAVLTLEEPIDFSQICAASICLNPSYRITSGQSCIVAGWGATSENSAVASSTLQEASVSTYHGTECSGVFPNAEASYFTDPSKQLCAGQPNVGGVDACTGDSGGPLMCLDQASSTWIQVGIVSYGEGCARANYPGVYTNTAVHHDWIHRQLNK